MLQAILALFFAGLGAWQAGVGHTLPFIVATVASLRVFFDYNPFRGL